jgi:hypothetical protein
MTAKDPGHLGGVAWVPSGSKGKRGREKADETQVSRAGEGQDQRGVGQATSPRPHLDSRAVGPCRPHRVGRGPADQRDLGFCRRHRIGDARSKAQPRRRGNQLPLRVRTRRMPERLHQSPYPDSRIPAGTTPVMVKETVESLTRIPPEDAVFDGIRAGCVLPMLAVRSAYL